MLPLHRNAPSDQSVCLCNRSLALTNRFCRKKGGGDKEGKGDGEGVDDGGWEALHPGVKDTAWKNVARRFMQDFQVGRQHMLDGFTV